VEEVAENPTDDGSEQGGAQEDGSDQRSCRVFVGNLSWRTSWQNLKDKMRDAGTVRFADVFYMRGTKGRRARSKGCGVVEFETPEMADKAIAELNECELDGRKIFVQKDNKAGEPRRRRTPKPRREDGGDGAGASSSPKKERGGDDKPRRKREKTEGANPKRVYVGNLAWRTSWQTLKDHMRTAGEVAFVDVFETYNGRSRGCALVEYETEEDAKNAIEKMNDTELEGRTIFVREDRDKKPKEDAQKDGDAGSVASENSGASDDGVRLYVGNLSFTTKSEELEKLFGDFSCSKVDIKKGKNGRSKGFAICTFDSQENAKKAIEKYHDTEVDGRFVTVREDRKPGRPYRTSLAPRSGGAGDDDAQDAGRVEL